MTLMFLITDVSTHQKHTFHFVVCCESFNGVNIHLALTALSCTKLGATDNLLNFTTENNEDCFFEQCGEAFRICQGFKSTGRELVDNRIRQHDTSALSSLGSRNDEWVRNQSGLSNKSDSSGTQLSKGFKADQKWKIQKVTVRTLFMILRSYAFCARHLWQA